MGTVWRAVDPVLGREVAVKILARRHAGGPAVEQRFLDEARITGQLDHPGIVPLHTLLRTGDGLPAYAMKRVDGTTLFEWLLERRQAVAAGTLDDRADLPGRLEVFLKVGDAVHFAHVRRLVRVGGGPVPMEGTPGFLAPEQANGALPDPAQDQYSLGLILQELVTLREAVAGRTALERALANAIGERVTPTLQDGRPPPRELCAILARATALDPPSRYPDVAALCADTRRYLAGEPIHASPDTAWQSTTRWVGRHREATLALLLGVAAVGGILIAVVALRAAAEHALAKTREVELAARVAAVADRAGHIDARLARDEGLLGEVAAAAAERLTGTVSGANATPWFADSPQTAPVDLGASDAYGSTSEPHDGGVHDPGWAAPARGSGAGLALAQVSLRSPSLDRRAPRPELSAHGPHCLGLAGPVPGTPPPPKPRGRCGSLWLAQ